MLTVLKNTYDRLVNPEKLVVAGKTPFDVVFQDSLIKVRHYGLQATKKRYAVPLVIVPPLAVNTLIYDWFPERSLVAYLVEEGFDVYLIDWGSPSRKHATYNLAKYIDDFMPKALAAVRQHSGQRSLSLHGWSMGGGFSLCYCAHSGDPDIKNIICLGTAIDGQANGEMSRFYGTLAQGFQQLGIAPQLIPAHVFHTTPWVNAVAFKIMDPVSSVQSYVDLFKNLDDRDFVTQHATMSAFLDNLEAYPGAVLRDWIVTLWLNNDPTKRGFFRMGKDKLHLKDVKANLLCIAGKKDYMSNPECTKALINLVASEDKRYLLFDDGHTGIVSGRNAPNTVWPQVVDWLSSRSG